MCYGEDLLAYGGIDILLCHVNSQFLKKVCFCNNSRVMYKNKNV